MFRKYMFVAFAIMKRRPRNRQLTIHQLVIAPETNCSCISSDIKPMQVEAYTMGNRRKMSYTRLLYREEKSCRRPSLPYESNLRVGLDEVNTLLDVLLEVTKATGRIFSTPLGPSSTLEAKKSTPWSL